MIVLRKLGIMKKCNLWINEKPNIEYKCIEQLQKVILKNKWVKWDSVSYVLEVNLKHRHSSNYALLGISYKYEDTKKLVIKVNSSKEDEKIIENMLVSNFDEVHAGIPLEYSRYIMNVASNYLNSIDCSSGIITFDIGGHGYIGSSSSIFGLVAKMLLRILSYNNKSDIKEIEQIILKELNER